MSHYTVTAERSLNGRWWVLQAVEAPGAISQVARLDQADEIREAIAFVTGEPEESIEITVQPTLPGEVASRLEALRELRARASQASAQAAAESRDIARMLVSEGLTLRDVGSVLDVSYQRAHQLVSASTGSTRAKRSRQQ